MTERKPCRRCQRAIDAMAGHCPFCNWDQNLPAPPPEEVMSAPNPAALYTPPEEFNLRKLIGISVGIVLMLVVSFLFGMLINRDGAPDKAPETAEEQAAEHNAKNKVPKRAATPLVPAGEGGIDQNPVTSAPAVVPPGQTPNDYQRTDATAVSAEEYAQMARRAQAEKKKKMAVLMDPRSLTGPAYAQGSSRSPAQRPRSGSSAPTLGGSAPQSMGGSAPPSMSQQQQAPQQQQQQQQQFESPRPARRAGMRTRPVPQYQPLPAIRGRGSARFNLLIGADGRVKDIDIAQTMVGGNTPALVAAVQNWRFKPATENGEPVAAPFSVEISFGRE
jgi:Gram-negative bacterial TonB protein C-terminal